jgi:bacteriocin-like protein
VVEESANVVYLVLPPQPTVELSDAELQAVSGGFSLASGATRGPGTGWYPLDEWLTTVLM